MQDSLQTKGWQVIHRCFVCGVTSQEERLVPATLAIAREDFSVHNQGMRRNAHVCLTCGGRVKTITDMFKAE